MSHSTRLIDGSVSRDRTIVADLLHDFNTEFGAPSPGPEVLAGRLETLLGGGSTLAIVAGEPAIGLALVTMRTNVWFDGPVALLDELYVAPPFRGRGIGSSIMKAVEMACLLRGAELLEVNVDEPDHDAIRFYCRHGFSLVEPDTGQRAFYISKPLA